MVVSFRPLIHKKHYGTWWALFNMSLNATPKSFILKYKAENATHLILVLNVEADHLLYTSASGFNLTMWQLITLTEWKRNMGHNEKIKHSNEPLRQTPVWTTKRQGNETWVIYSSSWLMNVWEMSSLFHESNMLHLLSFMLFPWSYFSKTFRYISIQAPWRGVMHRQSEV